MLNQIEMFSTHNDTDDYVVCVDGYFGRFTNKQEALDTYHLIDCIESSPFGAVQVLPPQCKPEFIDGSEPQSKISDHKPINIRHYIIKHTQRSWDNFELDKIRNRKTAKERLDAKRECNKFWAELLS